MLLRLYNNISKNTYEFTVNDTGNSNINYRVSFTLEAGMPDGEYSYKLFDNNKIVSRGLCIIGDFVPETTTYTKTENGYIQYES